jgi:hypothetical protein
MITNIVGFLSIGGVLLFFFQLFNGTTHANWIIVGMFLLVIILVTTASDEE